MMTIPSRACALLISAIRATTMAVAIQIAAGILPGQATMIILDPDQAPVPDRDLVPTAVQGQDQTVAAQMTIITVADRLSSFSRNCNLCK